MTTALEKTFKKKYADITDENIASLTALELPHVHIPCFKDGDFAGMTKLRKLHFHSLFHKEGKMDAVPTFTEKVFAKLPQLEELVIEDEELGI